MSRVVLSDYPNLQAILDGRVSGQVTEWPAIRKELQNLIDFYESELDWDYFSD